MIMLPYRWRFVVTIIYVLMVVLVSGLRDNIGHDFVGYANLYDTYANASFMAAMGDIVSEPTFAFVISLLGAIGGTYQLLFLFYSVVTILGMYYGFRYWLSKDGLAVFFAMILYITYNSTGGFWWGMNGIRQAAAMGIVFAFSRFIYFNKIKFYIGIGLGLLFHYSALIFFPAILMINKMFSKKKILLLVVLSVIFTISGISKEIVLSLLSVVFYLIGKYESALLFIPEGSKSFSYMSFVYVVLFLGSMYVMSEKQEERKKIIIFNLASVYMIMRILTSFSLGPSSVQYVLHRFETYYTPFFLVLLTETCFAISRRIKPIVCGYIVMASFAAVMAVLSIISIAKIGGYTDYPLEPDYPGDNVKYEYNTEVIE